MKRDPVPPPPAAAPADSPTLRLFALLERIAAHDGLFSLQSLVEATGWLPHTTRAALTGLKKKGHTVTKDKRDDVSCYRIAKAGE